MYWANFIHAYQPPFQKEKIVRRVIEESYRKVFSGLLKLKRAKLTLNINGVLCDFLAAYGGQDVLETIKKLLESGQLEITGSSKYHAFLPFLPESEIERQIILNERSLDKHFGELWRKNGKNGFFPTEMAYSRKVAEVAKRLGYKWLIIDELGFPGNHPSADRVYTIKGLGGLGVFFRERSYSFAISSAQTGAVSGIIRYFGERLEKNDHVVTAMDCEMFGHHRPGLENLLFELLESEKIQPATLSELFSAVSKKEEIEPRDSTWAVTKNNLKENLPYSRWKRPDNPIQVNQWKLTDLAIELVGRGGEAEWRERLDKALHSDHYWWASARPWWSLEMLERGLYELKEIILSSEKATLEEKKLAENLYKEAIYTGFNWQRSGYVDELSRQEDEEVRDRLEEKEKFFITKKEYAEMIKTWQEQMRLAGKAEEYHRAAMIQDRIRELQIEMEKVKE